MQPDTEQLAIKTDDWKKHGSLQKAVISGKEKSTQAEVYIKTWTRFELRLKALRTFIICIILAGVSVLIPLAHFLLVPGFLIAAVTLPFMSLSGKSLILGGSGTCPYCGSIFEVARSANRWPLDDICSACSRHVKISKAG